VVVEGVGAIALDVMANWILLKHRTPETETPVIFTVPEASDIGKDGLSYPIFPVPAESPML
jgi:hypothetical protein